ncbi:hypothetical protein [Synechococcus sp. MIT S1220]|uniref:hypothetical protein n=1 Tax=Synechococcus sp. MIT S1220 TaxID=3082549 RepID=UPI0039AEA50E
MPKGWARAFTTMSRAWVASSQSSHHGATPRQLRCLSRERSRHQCALAPDEAAAGGPRSGLGLSQQFMKRR